MRQLDFMNNPYNRFENRYATIRITRRISQALFWVGGGIGFISIKAGSWSAFLLCIALLGGYLYLTIRASKRTDQLIEELREASPATFTKAHQIARFGEQRDRLRRHSLLSRMLNDYR